MKSCVHGPSSGLPHWLCCSCRGSERLQDSSVQQRPLSGRQNEPAPDRALLPLPEERRRGSTPLPANQQGKRRGDTGSGQQLLLLYSEQDVPVRPSAYVDNALQPLHQLLRDSAGLVSSSTVHEWLRVVLSECTQR